MKTMTRPQEKAVVKKKVAPQGGVLLPEIRQAYQVELTPEAVARLPHLVKLVGVASTLAAEAATLKTVNVNTESRTAEFIAETADVT